MNFFYIFFEDFHVTYSPSNIVLTNIGPAGTQPVSHLVFSCPYHIFFTIFSPIMRLLSALRTFSEIREKKCFCSSLKKDRKPCHTQFEHWSTIIVSFFYYWFSVFNFFVDNDFSNIVHHCHHVFFMALFLIRKNQPLCYSSFLQPLEISVKTRISTFLAEARSAQRDWVVQKQKPSFLTTILPPPILQPTPTINPDE